MRPTREIASEWWAAAANPADLPALAALIAERTLTSRSAPAAASPFTVDVLTHALADEQTGAVASSTPTTV